MPRNKNSRRWFDSRVIKQFNLIWPACFSGIFLFFIFYCPIAGHQTFQNEWRQGWKYELLSWTWWGVGLGVEGYLDKEQSSEWMHDNESACIFRRTRSRKSRYVMRPDMETFLTMQLPQLHCHTFLTSWAFQTVSSQIKFIWIWHFNWKTIPINWTN